MFLRVTIEYYALYIRVTIASYATVFVQVTIASYVLCLYELPHNSLLLHLTGVTTAYYLGFHACTNQPYI